MSNYECKQFTEWYFLADDVYPFTIVMVVIVCLFVLPTVVLNALIFAAVVLTPTLQTPSNILTCNLAAANLGLMVISVPFGAAWKLLELYHHDYDIVCNIAFVNYSIGSFFTAGSYLTLAFATLDRYLALILHLRYPVLVTNGRVIIACVFYWFTSLIQIPLLLLGGNTYYISASILIVLFFFIIVFSYSQIFTIIRRHHSQITSQAVNTTTLTMTNSMTRYRKSVFNLLYVICCQFAFLTPYLVSMIVLASYGVSVWSIGLWSVSICFTYINSFVNPLIICMRYGELRAATKDIARSCWRRVKRPINHIIMPSSSNNLPLPQ